MIYLIDNSMSRLTIKDQKKLYVNLGVPKVPYSNLYYLI